MKLSVYANKVGVSYKTAHRWFQSGKIPGAYQIGTGTVIVPDSAIPELNTTDDVRYKTVVYARVSSSEQRNTNLATQAERMQQFCIGNGWAVDSVVKEVGSGLNDERPKLLTLLKDPSVKRIVVEHRDRLTRFGFNYLQTLADIEGFELIVANQTLDNDNDDLMADFTSIITSFCARLYSKRRGKNKASKIKETLNETNLNNNE